MISVVAHDRGHIGRQVAQIRKVVQRIAPCAVDEIGEATLVEPLITVVMAGEDNICPPGLERPLHSAIGAMIPGGIGSVMERDEVVAGGGGGQGILQPDALNRGFCAAVRFAAVAIYGKQADEAEVNFVVPFVVGEGEVVEVGSGTIAS